MDKSENGLNNASYGSALQAFRTVSKADKRNGFIMLGAAAVTILFGMLSRLIWLAEPVLDMIYHGTAVAVYYGLLGILFAGYVIGLNLFLKRVVNVRIFAVNKPMDEKQAIIRAALIIAVGAVAVFIASAYNGFKLKLQVEMGLGVTIETAILNIIVYVFYGLHLWLGFIAADLVQRGMSAILPSKYGIPFGSIFLVTVFGLGELALEVFSTAHMFPFIYYLFTYVYAAVYEITGRRFHLSYWASVVVMIL